jgi:hypothetical protein
MKEKKRNYILQFKNLTPSIWEGESGIYQIKQIWDGL